MHKIWAKAVPVVKHGISFKLQVSYLSKKNQNPQLIWGQHEAFFVPMLRQRSSLHFLAVSHFKTHFSMAVIKDEKS